MRWCQIPILLLAVAACGDDDAPPADAAIDSSADATVDAAADAGPLEVRCNAGTRYSPGTSVFREVTAEWGLEGVVGTRISVLDIDGDGFADVFVRDGAGPDDFSAGGERRRWLLRNAGGTSFEDVTEASGLLARREGEPGRSGEVVASADADNDGDVDIFLATGVSDAFGPGDRAELMLNAGDGTFALGPVDSEARRQDWVSVPAGVTFTDFDRDGLVDLWTTQNMPGGSTTPLQDGLYRGDGAGGFTDVTAAAGLETLWWTSASIDQMDQALGHSWAWSSAACDLNGDGTPELLASSYGRMTNHLWLGSRDSAGAVTFDNHSVASGYAFDHRTDWSDNESARCYCTLHPTEPECAGVPAPTATRCTSDADILRWRHATDRHASRLGGNSGATLCADVNNDGSLDLLTGEIVHWDVGSNSDPSELLLNSLEDPLRFDRPGNDVTGLERVHDRTDWNDGIMTTAVLDFDNDGWLDVYLGNSDYPGTRGLLYHQDAPGHFTELPIADYFEHFRSHGVVAVDFDRDGDLDLLVGHSTARCGSTGECYPTRQVRLFENLLGAEANWIQVTLEGGAGTNRSAIGAQVNVAAGGVTQMREVDGGHGHFNTQDDLTLHFGLGSACDAEVTVRWPDAALTTETATVQSGYRWILRQGEAPAPVR